MSLLSELMGGTAVSGTPSGERQLLYYYSSDTFTAPFDMDVVINSFAPGGTGGVARAIVSGTDFMSAAATGGGSGARSRHRVALKKGEVLSLTVGTVSALNSIAGAGSVALAGLDGGNNVITGPGGLNIVTGGGKGGKAAIGAALSATLLGGLGGVSTGADDNVDGARGGNIAGFVRGSKTDILIATGGAATNFLLGVSSTRGGDVTGTNPNGNTSRATGGGGIGGPAPDETTVSTTDPVSLKAGMCGAEKLAEIPGNFNISGTTAFTLPDLRSILGLTRTIGPNQTTVSNSPGPGAGGFPSVSPTTAQARGGGKFAGGGGATASSGSSCQGGSGGDYGGGAGGVASSLAIALSSQGGSYPAVIVLEVLM